MQASIPTDAASIGILTEDRGNEETDAASIGILTEALASFPPPCVIPVKTGIHGVGIAGVSKGLDSRFHGNDARVVKRRFHSRLRCV